MEGLKKFPLSDWTLEGETEIHLTDEKNRLRFVLYDYRSVNPGGLTVFLLDSDEALYQYTGDMGGDSNKQSEIIITFFRELKRKIVESRINGIIAKK